MKVREYDFEIDDSFFAYFEYGEIERGSLTARLEVFYSSRQVQVNLFLRGNVKLPCDRCLEIYDQKIDSKYTLYGRFSGVADQDDIDVFWIPENENYIDLVPVLYDYICLSLPLKRIHPDDDKGVSLCNGDMMRRLDELGLTDN